MMRESAEALLCMFTPDQLQAVGEYIRRRPDFIPTIIDIQRREYIAPLAQILPIDSVEPEVLGNILRGLYVVQQDFLSAQWTAEQYETALTRGAGISQDLAHQLVANRVVTPDTNLRGFASKILNWIPDISLLTPEKAALHGILNIADSVLDAIIPTDWRNYSRDVLYELQNLGGVIKEMGVRSSLVKVEAALETVPEVTAANAQSTATAAAMAAIPYLAKGVLRALSAGHEGGDIGGTDGTSCAYDGMRQLSELMLMRPNEGGDMFSDILGKVASAARTVAPVIGTVAQGAQASGTPMVRHVPPTNMSGALPPPLAHIMPAAMGVSQLPLAGRPVHRRHVHHIAAEGARAKTPNDMREMLLSILQGINNQAGQQR